jgi:hypothetical protein
MTWSLAQTIELGIMDYQNAMVNESENMWMKTVVACATLPASI